jgi:hypothetical protein
VSTRLVSAPAPAVEPLLTLTVSQLSMLARFALLSELQRPSVDAAGEAAESPGMLTYARSSAIEGLEEWWPFLTAMAREWLLQRRTQ